MKESIREFPIVALRDLVVMPGVMLHFDMKRDISVAAVEAAMEKERTIFLVTQIKPEVEEPTKEDLYEVGTIAEIKQILKLPDKSVRVLIQGIQRGNLLSVEKDTYLTGVIKTSEEEESLSAIDNMAWLCGLKDIVSAYIREDGKISPNVAEMLMKQTKLSDLIDQTTANIPITTEAKQQILETEDLLERYNKLAIMLNNAIEILRLQKEITSKVKASVDKHQKEFYLREQLHSIREELGDSSETETEEFEKKLEKLKAKKKVKKRISKEIARLGMMPSSSSESAIVRTYIETLLAMPWKKSSKDNEDFAKAKEILENDHYGLEDVKKRVLEFLAVRALQESENQGSILCLVGPPGTGKTSIARSIARALDKKYVRICLGGVRDEAEIRGHRRTYLGAMPGRIANALKEAKVNNPLVLFDEIDKIASDHKGDPASALLEVLDGEQNSAFSDHYMEIPIDVSKVFFVCTANTTDTIPQPLLDRMEVIEISGYTKSEKFQIAKRYLVDKQRKKAGLETGQFSVTDKALEQIIEGYTREAGVRKLEQKIAALCRKTALEIVDGTSEKVRISTNNLTKYLGKVKYTTNYANKKPQVGIVRGLAWTSVGGETLEVQVTVMPGSGGLELTGKLGEVMCESAKIALSYVRSISSAYKLEEDFFEKHDIHIHVPEGAVPKDGPSAGITMATAILSAVTEIKVRPDVAMTGEINLRGDVMPIGGLKEKLLAAKTAGIKKVLIPKKNQGDYEELPEEITKDLEIVQVSQMKQVLSMVLE